MAIALAWHNARFPRPLTHDLACSLLEVVEARLVRVGITELKDRVLYAKVHVARDGEEPKSVDARPSDAVALRAKVPILVAEEVFAQASVE